MAGSSKPTFTSLGATSSIDDSPLIVIIPNYPYNVGSPSDVNVGL